MLTHATSEKSSSSSFINKKKQQPFFSPVMVQPKLAIGPVDDPYEREADAMADKVMRMTGNDTIKVGTSPVTIQKKCAACEEEEKIQRKEEHEKEKQIVQKKLIADLPIQRKCAGCEKEEKLQRKEENEEKGQLIQTKLIADLPIQRKCAACEEEEKLQRKEEDEEKGQPIQTKLIADLPIQRKCAHCEQEENEERLQMSAENGRAAAHGFAPPIVHDVLGMPGQPLDPASQAFFEPRFGRDFGDVRVHTDARAAESARAVGALAYTFGRNIFFANGRYAPATTEGTRLLAHELTHVIQQSGLESVQVQRQKSPFEDFDDDTEAGGSAGDLDVHLECPSVPTGLGKKSPIPQCTRTTFSGLSELGRWHFCLDSDIVLPTENFNELDAMLRDQPPSTRFIVQGHASPEGAVENNFNLSCHRANAIATELDERMRKKLALEGKSGNEINAQVRIRIETGSRGPTSEFGGNAAANRVVVVFGQIPQHGVGFEPACEIAPRKLGDVKPEIPCDPVTADLLHQEKSDQLRTFRFCLDSDVLSEGGAGQIVSFVNGQASSATYVIHGFASTEGDLAYNRRLSCHRALRIAREIMNVGVPPVQIREVSGLGETKNFGDELHLNRVVLVLAEKGAISNVGETQVDLTGKKDEAVRNAAVARLLAGQYRQEADAYISFWTCGRTPTVRQAVKRLLVLLSDAAQRLIVAPPVVANGQEEGIGPNNVRLSIQALRADNPVECTMGRIVDMAFHHSTIGDASLGAALSTEDPTTRHAAGLHLIHLAGLTACTGRFAEKKGTGLRIEGIDEPLVSDPLATATIPACARSPQSTRLLVPSAGEKQRQAPEFITFVEKYLPKSGSPQRGTLSNVSIKEKTDPIVNAVTPVEEVITASATVGLVGDVRTFGDYEIGFILNILGDLTTADYVTGDQVLHQLSAPIRAAQLPKEPPVPEPWMAAGAAKRPDASGVARDIEGSWKLNLDFASFFSFFIGSAENRRGQLDFLQRKTNVGIWLAARRVGAPVDRFSVIPLGGRIFQVIQDLDLEARRVGGDLLPEDRDSPGVEHEHLFSTGTFVASETSFEPADFKRAVLLNPAASEIDLTRQVRRFRVHKAPADGISETEFKEIVREILDSIQIFGSDEDMKTNTDAKTVARLGFDFTALDISIPVTRSTGRTAGNLIVVKAPRLGDRVIFHLLKALALRLAKTDSLKKGKSIVLSADAVKRLPGDDRTGNVDVHLDPLVNKEPDLAFIQNGINVIDDMTEMIVCTRIMAERRLDPREFGATYWMDRDKKLHREPADRFQMGKSSLDCTFDLQLPCIEHRTGMVIGSVHTHPGCIPKDPDATKNPSPTDLKFSGSAVCGFQHYVISTEGVLSFNTGQKVTARDDVGARIVAKLGSTVCGQPLPDDPETSSRGRL